MQYFSSHAIIRWKDFVLYNEDNPDMGPMPPGGLFNSIELKELSKIDSKDEKQRIELSKKVLQRELQEEMHLQPNIETFLRYIQDTSFVGDSGKVYHYDGMYFWRVDLPSLDIGAIYLQTGIVHDYLHISKIDERIKSEAIKNTIRLYFSNFSPV